MVNAHVNMLQRVRDHAPVSGINCIGMLTHQGGLGNASRMNARALELIYTKQRVHRVDFPSKTLADPRKIKPRHNLNYLHFSPDMISIDAARQCPWYMNRNIGYFAWETTQPPESWKKMDRDLEQIWVPSNFVANTLRAYGMSKPIHVIPHAIIIPPKVQQRKCPDAFTFLVTFDGKSRIERKRPDIAIAAIRRALHESKERGKVIIKCHDVAEMRLILDKANRMCADIGGLGNLKIAIEDKWKSEAEMEILWTQIDIVVSTNRGEGFGLPMLEAMARGVAVVATGWGGTGDFLNHETGYPVNHLDLVPVRNDLYYKTGNWAEPSRDHAVSQIQSCMGDFRRGSIQTTLDAARNTAEKHSLEHLAAKMREALGNLI